MAAFKVLAALLVVCVAQNVAYASFFDKKEMDSFALMQTAEIFGVFSPVIKFVKCLPTLTETYKWFQEIKQYFREYREITLANKAAKEECNDKLNGAELDQCLKAADAKFANARVELFTRVDKFTTRTFEGFSQFYKCINAPPSA